MKKPLAICSADWHFHKFKVFDKDNSRLKYTANAVDHILKQAKDLKIPVLFMGDMIHNPVAIDNEVLFRLVLVLEKYRTEIDLYAISGNHDMPYKNITNNSSISYLNTFAYLRLVKLARWGNYIDTSLKYLVYGFDYHDNDEDLLKNIKELEGSQKFRSNRKIKKILMLHSDVPGALTPNGIELNEAKHFPKHLDKLFKEWDLVLFGHIHKPQKLSNKCYMIGSPIHQVSSDAGTWMGYWIIYTDLSIKFISLNKKFPQFIRLKKDEEPYNTLDYFIPYEETQAMDYEEPKEDTFNINLSRKELAERYCKVKGIKGNKKKELINILTTIE